MRIPLPALRDLRAAFLCLACLTLAPSARAASPDDTDSKATETKSTTGDDEKPASTSAPESDSSDQGKPAKSTSKRKVVNADEADEKKPTDEQKPADDSARSTDTSAAKTVDTAEKKPVEETSEEKKPAEEAEEKKAAPPEKKAEPAATPAPHKVQAAAPTTAHKPRLLPITVSNSDNAGRPAARIAYIIESAVRHSRSARFELADPLEVFDPVGTQQRADLNVRATDALAFGKKSYDGLEEGLGLESFDRALAAYQEGALWQNMKSYAKAEVMRILIRWADDPGGTKREIANLLLVDPKAEFPKEQVPQDLAQEIQVQKEGIANLPRATLDVSTSPTPGRVYLDGIYRGTAPASIRDLPVGDHFLSVIAPGYEVQQQQVHIIPGAATSITLHVVDKARPYLTLINRIGAAFNKPDEVTAAVLLGQISSSDQVLDASVTRHNGILTVELHRFEVKDGHSAAAVTLTGLADNDPQLATKVAEAVETALATDRPRCQKGEACDVPAVTDVDMGGDKQSNGSGARAGVVTASSILLAAGVGLFVAAHFESVSFTKLVQTDPTLPARGNAVLGTLVGSGVAGGLGLVGFSIWAYLQFGLAAQQRSQNIGPGVPLDNSAPAPTQPAKPPPTQRKDDPFDTQLAPTTPGPAFAFVAAPQPGGATFGVVGVFP